MNDRPKYQDEKWLLQKRGKECLSYQQIARLCGTNPHAGTVAKWCHRFNIEKGELSYKDYEWMYKQYVERERSSRNIAKELGISGDTVLDWLRKLNIQVRTSGEGCALAVGNHVEITKNLLEILNGSLLGDGSLGVQSLYSAHYELGQKHRSYCKWMSKLLKEHGIRQCGNINRREKNREEVHKTLGYPPPEENKVFVSYYYTSLDYHELRTEYNRWYPSSGKRVPNDLTLTPLTMLIWFLEDGSFSPLKDQKVGRIQIATQGFPKGNVYFLQRKLSDLLGISKVHVNPKKHNHRFGWSISFSSAPVVKSFFSYLAPLPDCLKADYGYKFPSNYL